MKKTLYKTLFAGFFLCLLACFGAGMGVSAKEAKTYREGWMQWRFDADTGTLYATALPKSQEARDALEELYFAQTDQWADLRHVVENTEGSEINVWFSANSEIAPNLETAEGVIDGIKWKIDFKTGAVRLEGKGPLSANFAHEFPYLLSNYDDTAEIWPNYTIDIGDGITTFPPEVITWYKICETMRLGKTAVPREELGLAVWEGFSADPANSHCAVYNGALYSKDYHILYAMPQAHFDAPLHPSLKTMGNYTLKGSLDIGQSTVSWSLDTTARTLTFTGKGETQPELPYHLTLLLYDYWAFYDRLVLDVPFRNISLPYAENWQAKTLVLSRFAETFDNNSSLGFNFYAFEVDPANPYLAVYDGALYTKDFSRLISVPREKTSIRLHPDVKILSANAFDNSEVRMVVVPWGATTLEEGAFTLSYATVILPDTVTSIGYQYPRFNYNDDLRFVCSDKLRQSAGRELVPVMPERIPVYFSAGTADEAINRIYHSGSRDPGWVGQNQYLLADGSWAKGWKKVDGYWYFLDQQGILTQGWLKDKGTTYYLQPGGAMAATWCRIPDEDWQTDHWYCFEPWGGLITNRWIYGLDKKWYYVGADGAMLTDTVTPDGYRVNADGQWVR